ncbi:MAG: 50S ribosomal protein L24 [Candidatus Ryanbacteria bacterium RIFCSPHIGHO2_02_FULL_48_12]|jgi:large subunit ribosomal protein L24|uniref:Large ribosomal subunit protein uL24 n=1 Tax=Candidatus Ryanbacteria bacterium RIFCSPHIGHO2_01_FULL_48_27 TaxID=1802115 RepID=A0A1G2G421_9BACT|nr:MAG: 50S ribosomal protein L24 [Candidatus Ryanbacteria bacterium RIFCSPHIGHO2_01_FULL_48_27]OGZ50764.1 MAG: 50S ribosomal protein L24 [Candidatus Ryanbacteria bacterium RIFCSPHIGHO2_02_FULL_48_12]
MALNKPKIKKGDTVRVLQGKDRSKSAKVIAVLPLKERVVVDGLNMHKRHIKPRRGGKKGEIIQIPAPMHISNVQIVCPSCGKPTRVGYRITETTKVRTCKKCKADIA